MKSTLLVVFSSVVLHVNGMPLMMGKMVGQGETKAEALGQMNPKDVEEVKVIFNKILACTIFKWHNFFCFFYVFKYTGI